MSRQLQIVLIILAGLIIITGIVLFILKFSGGPVVQNVTVNETKPVAKVSDKTLQQAANDISFPEPSAADKAQVQIKNLSLSFAERFGTYTNQSDYSSISDLLPMMTASMADWTVKQYIPQLKKTHDPAGFPYRIVTQGPAVSLSDVSAGKATATVATSRVETVGDKSPREFLQSLVLNFVSQNGGWLVDAAFWK
ncbi:MAG: hypothetical protein V1763_01090 [Parcubacteria group bacterium]